MEFKDYIKDLESQLLEFLYIELSILEDMIQPKDGYLVMKKLCLKLISSKNSFSLNLLLVLLKLSHSHWILLEED